MQTDFNIDIKLCMCVCWEGGVYIFYEKAIKN